MLRSRGLAAIISLTVASGACVFDPGAPSRADDQPDLVDDPADVGVGPGIPGASDAGATTQPEVPALLTPFGMGIVTDFLGGNGGDSYSIDCPDGRVVVGFDADDNDFGLCHLRSVCRALRIVDGSLVFDGEVMTEAVGSENSTRPTPPVRCPNGQLVVGFRGTRGPAPDRLVHSIRIECAPIAWDGSAAIVGASEGVDDDLGSPSSLGTGSGHCEHGTVAAGFTGRAGTIVDRFAMRCFALNQTF